MKNADIVFMSTPVLQIVPMIEQILPFLKPGTIITDTGSTKQYIWNHLKNILPREIYYVAGHPMTGKRTQWCRSSGFKSSQEVLCDCKRYRRTTSGY